MSLDYKSKLSLIPEKTKIRSVEDYHEILSKILDNERKGLENQSKKSELELRVKIWEWVKIIVSSFLGFVACLLILILAGKANNVEGFSDSVLIAILTTTTINILGLPFLIIKSLFPALEKMDKGKIKP